MNIPLGFDIITLDIIGHLKEPWTMLAEAMQILYARITQEHGSPPDMDTICRKMDWFDSDDDLQRIFVTWDAPDTEDTQKIAPHIICVIGEGVGCA